MTRLVPELELFLKTATPHQRDKFETLQILPCITPSTQQFFTTTGAHDWTTPVSNSQELPLDYRNHTFEQKLMRRKHVYNISPSEK
ncbi:hypothetical protein TNCV_3608611, partial [Trichonephila clavipes]